MSEISERYRKVAGQFTEVATAVPEDAWDNPAPCEGWVARDVVRHLVEWIPPFLRERSRHRSADGTESVDDDPVAAWKVLSDGIQALLDDPADRRESVQSRTRRTAHASKDAIDMFFLNDVLIHTWDLARATGGDETLDADEVHRMFSWHRAVRRDVANQRPLRTACCGTRRRRRAERS